MATELNAYGQLTLVELAKRKDPNGELAAIAEVLAEDNEIIQDAPWVEANNTFSHKITRRASLPAGSWRKVNEGVSTEASRTIEAMDVIGSLETYSEVDKLLADNAPNPRQFRNDEAGGFLEGLSQTLASTIMYGNSATTPESMTGLAPRMSSLDASNNVLDGGGSGSDNTSIYVVMWQANRRVFLVYPKGSERMGINHKDLGEVTLEDASGNYYQGYRDHFQVQVGLCVKDDRCIGRIANLEVSGTANLFDEDDIIRLSNRMPAGPKWMYVNDTIKSQMEIRMKDKTNIWYSSQKGEGLVGEEVLKMRGIPVRKVDQIINTEATLS